MTIPLEHLIPYIVALPYNRLDFHSNSKLTARVGTTSAGVNGFYDMGANVWEWVDIPDKLNKGTRGGSWWYGARQMKADYNATKPRDMAVVYIGFRCVNGSKVDVSAYKKVVSN